LADKETAPPSLIKLRAENSFSRGTRKQRGQVDLAGTWLNPGGPDGRDLLLAQRSADDIKSTGERGSSRQAKWAGNEQDRDWDPGQCLIAARARRFSAGAVILLDPGACHFPSRY
jgi:hypothetical protein